MTDADAIAICAAVALTTAIAIWMAHAARFLRDDQ